MFGVTGCLEMTEKAYKSQAMEKIAAAGKNCARAQDGLIGAIDGKIAEISNKRVHP